MCMIVLCSLNRTIEMGALGFFGLVWWFGFFLYLYLTLWLSLQSFDGGNLKQVQWTYGAPGGLVWNSGKCPD